MPNKEVKYDIGDRVSYDGEIPGKITAIYIRGGNTAYEFSYLNDGKPDCTNVEEVEIEPIAEGDLGFRSKNNG